MNLWIEWFRCVRELRTASRGRERSCGCVPGRGVFGPPFYPTCRGRITSPSNRLTCSNVHRASDWQVRVVDGSGVGLEDPSCVPSTSTSSLSRSKPRSIGVNRLSGTRPLARWLLPLSTDSIDDETLENRVSKAPPACAPQSPRNSAITAPKRSRPARSPQQAVVRQRAFPLACLVEETLLVSETLCFRPE